jgi:hypothetical protein
MTYNSHPEDGGYAPDDAHQQFLADEAQALDNEAQARDAEGAAAIADLEAKEQAQHNLDLLLTAKAVAIVNISPEHDPSVTALYQEYQEAVNEER